MNTFHIDEEGLRLRASQAYRDMPDSLKSKVNKEEFIEDYFIEIRDATKKGMELGNSAKKDGTLFGLCGAGLGLILGVGVSIPLVFVFVGIFGSAGAYFGQKMAVNKAKKVGFEETSKRMTAFLVNKFSEK